MAGHKDTFYGGKSGEVEHIYEFEKWKTETSDWKDSIREDDLQNAQSVTVKIENTETGGVAYNTLTGPFDDWQSIADLCEENWGPDGYDELK